VLRQLRCDLNLGVTPAKVGPEPRFDHSQSVTSAKV